MSMIAKAEIYFSIYKGVWYFWPIIVLRRDMGWYCLSFEFLCFSLNIDREPPEDSDPEPEENESEEIEEQ
jgi:hypothetical protein